MRSPVEGAYDAVVVGSGFGGSVAALRLAQRGERVAVLEMGRRHRPDDLSAGQRRLSRLLWAPPLAGRGYLRQSLFRHVFLVSGVGVGGGSIVYAAVLLEAAPEAFAQPGWAGLGVDWPSELAPHYAEARRMLGVATNPDAGEQDRWLGEAAAALEAGDSFGPVPQGILFDPEGARVPDPFFGGDGPDRTGCVRCGGCIAGCPHDAKNTLDRNYLALAERLGAAVLDRHRVVRIDRADPNPAGDRPDGHGYEVLVDDPLRPGSRPRRLRARRVFLAAGVVGTNTLLFACRDRWRSLPDLPAALGTRVRTNSEAFVGIVQPDPDTDLLRGTTISSHFTTPDGRTHITQNRFPDSYGFMRFYLGPLVDGDTPAERRRRALAALVRRPDRWLAAVGARRWNRRVTVLTVMQHADNALAFRYRKGLAGWRLTTTLPPGEERAPTYLPEANAAGRAFARASGGEAFGTLLESLLDVSTTAHVLGGCPIGRGPVDGVVDVDHQVFGHPGLYVVDGSAVPANIGVNPSLTITALAERALARVPALDTAATR